MNFLNYDSSFMTECRKAVNFVLLGLLWMMASIPLVTFGAATTAMYYTIEKVVRKDEGKIWKTFWISFKNEFKQSTAVWLIGLVVTIVLGANAMLLIKGQLPSVLFALMIAAEVLGVGWMQLWYGYLSRFQDKTGVMLSNTFRIALISLPKLVVMILIFVLAVVVVAISFFFAPPVILLVPGVYAALTGIMLRKIYKPYLPEEPKDDGDMPTSEGKLPEAANAEIAEQAQ